MGGPKTWHVGPFAVKVRTGVGSRWCWGRRAPGHPPWWVAGFTMPGAMVQIYRHQPWESAR